MALQPILVKRKQTTTSRLQCPVCEERFWLTSKFMNHMATHQHLLLSCNICNKGFYDQAHLDEHYLTHVEVISTYDCKQCPRKFLQKFELEQHIQFSCTPSQPPSKKKKSVHFNNVPESRTIEDSNDLEEEECSSEDEDAGEANYVPYKIFTQTRSGRVVKAKKIFENEEPEKKRRRLSKSKIYPKVSVTASVVKDKQKTSVSVESLPLTQKLEPKPTVTKELSIVSERLSDDIYKKFVEMGNICISGTPSLSEAARPHIQTTSSSGEKSESPAEIAQVHHSPSHSPIKINRVNSRSYKNHKLENTVNSSNVPVKSVSISETYIKHPASQSNITTRSTVPARNNEFSVRHIVDRQLLETPSAIERGTNPSNAPQIIKEFMYVGPNPDMNKIKQVLEEMKTMSKDTSVNETNDLCSNPVRAVNNSSLDSAAAKSSGSQPSRDSLMSGESDNLKGNFPTKSSEGILDKKIVKDFIVIKVTPEFMQKMQREKMDLAAQRPQTEAEMISSEISLITSSSNNSVCVVNKETKSHITQVDALKVNVPSTSNVSVLHETPTSSDIEMHEDSSDKNQVEETSDKVPAMIGRKTEPLSDPEAVSLLSMNQKLVDRYRAKLEEKECKKKKKYELKKKMRFMEILSKKSVTVKEAVPPSKVLVEENRTENQHVKTSGKHQRNTNESILSKIPPFYTRVIENQHSATKDKPHKVYSSRKSRSAGHEKKKQIRAVRSSTLEKSRKSIDNEQSVGRVVTIHDPYSDASIGENDTHTIGCPCHSNNCNNSTLHVMINNDDSVDILTGPSHDKLKKAESAIQKAREISLKFSKNLSEKEYLKLLDELDNLITHFNIAKKCTFLSPIIRFCRLYSGSSRVKDQAVALSTKLKKD